MLQASVRQVWAALTSGICAMTLGALCAKKFPARNNAGGGSIRSKDSGVWILGYNDA